MGELWVTYDVELIHEKISPEASSDFALLEIISPTSGFASVGYVTQYQGKEITMSSSVVNTQSVVPGYYVMIIEMNAANG